LTKVEPEIPPERVNMPIFYPLEIHTSLVKDSNNLSQEGTQGDLSANNMGHPWLLRKSTGW